MKSGDRTFQGSDGTFDESEPGLLLTVAAHEPLLSKPPMHKLVPRTVQAILCGLAITSSVFVDAGGAAPFSTQPKPPVFTPACAVRPKCIIHICVRSGRCSLGSHTQMSGCLFYACKGRQR